MNWRWWLWSFGLAVLVACEGGKLDVPVDAKVDAWPDAGTDAPFLPNPTGGATGGAIGMGGTDTGGGFGSGGQAGMAATGGSGSASLVGCSLFGFWNPGGNPDRSACGPSYTEVWIHIASASTPRDDVAECRITITDEAGTLLFDEALPKLFSNVAGELYLKAGCAAGLTNMEIGNSYFVTSRLAGALKLEVNAYDEVGGLVQTGGTVTAVAPYPPAVTSSIAITRPPSGTGGAPGGAGGDGGRGGAGGAAGGTAARNGGAVAARLAQHRPSWRAKPTTTRSRALSPFRPSRSRPIPS